MLHQEWQDELNEIMQGEWQDEGPEELDSDPNSDTEERGKRFGVPLNTAILGVLLIRRAAAKAANVASSNTRPGKGGKRNKGKRHEVALIESLFGIHDNLHRQYPAHIKPPGISTASDGKSLTGVTLRFTVACLAILSRHAPELCDISDNIIRHRFRDWQAKSRIRE